MFQNKGEQSQTCLGYAERKEQSPQGNVPNLRFPEFSGEWDRIKVSDLLEFYPTNSLSWEQLDYSGEGIFNLHYGLIHKGLPTQVDVSENNLPTIKDEYIPKKMSLCQNGDVAFADASEDTNDVAKCLEFANCEDRKIVCGLHTIHGRDSINKTIDGFKGYAFAAPAFRQQIRRLAQGTKIYSVSSNNFAECYIGIPSKAEQTKIAELLYKLDKRIATQIKIIEDLKKLKSAISNEIFEQTSNRICELKEIASVIMGQSPSSHAYNNNAEGLPLIQGNLDIENGQLSPRIYTHEITQTCECGDVILTVRAPVGEIAIAQQEACIGRGVCSIRPHVKNDTNLIYQFLQYFKPKWGSLEQGSTFTAVSGTDIRGIAVSIPSADKIELLNVYDNKIRVESRILTNLTQQKQYLLAQMFI